MIPRKLYKGEKFGAVLTLWNQLIDYLLSIRLIAGKGIRLSHTPAGTVISALPDVARRTAGASGGADGCFVVSLADNTGKLDVSGGFVCVNGQTFVMEKQQVDIQSGLLCVKVALNDSGMFADPALEYSQYDQWHYPVAKITVNENGECDILQYPVTVASFMLVRTCVFAQAARNGK